MSGVATIDRQLAQALRELLERRTAAPVELVETHLSWILLTRRVALKLKKAVRLPFVDYASVEARRHCCLEELRVNRRFAPTLYRAVLAVRGTPEAPRFGGAGEPIDHVVCMRRFPDGALLSERLEHGLDTALLEQFAMQLEGLHRAAPRLARCVPKAWPEQVLQAMLAVMNQLCALGAEERIAPLRDWVDAQARALWEVWQARRQDGAVRECHGDLHAGNLVLLDNRIVAFDAIDFDPGLRWIDVMSDVAFLAMDLQARGRADLAFAFVDEYLQAGGDFGGVRVLRFYAVYRALVRMLAGLLARSDSGPDYGAAARHWAGEGAARLVITHGLSGSGKSTAARALARSAGAIRVRSDVERKRLFGDLRGGDGDGHELYSPQASRRTYEHLVEAARAGLEAGLVVIVDAAFLRVADRRRFATLARQQGVPFEILHCVADDATSRERLQARARRGADPSDATVAVWEAQKRQVEALTVRERDVAIRCTGEAAQLAAIAARWREGLRAPIPA
jgi:hypothetical protein